MFHSADVDVAGFAVTVTVPEGDDVTSLTIEGVEALFTVKEAAHLIACLADAISVAVTNGEPDDEDDTARAEAAQEAYANRY